VHGLFSPVPTRPPIVITWIGGRMNMVLRRAEIALALGRDVLASYALATLTTPRSLGFQPLAFSLRGDGGERISKTPSMRVRSTIRCLVADGHYQISSPVVVAQSITLSSIKRVDERPCWTAGIQTGRTAASSHPPTTSGSTALPFQTAATIAVGLQWWMGERISPAAEK